MPFILKDGKTVDVSYNEILKKGTSMIKKKQGKSHVVIGYHGTLFPYEVVLWNASYLADQVKPNDTLLFRDGNPLNTELWNLQKIPGGGTSKKLATSPKDIFLGNTSTVCSECGRKIPHTEDSVVIQGVKFVPPVPLTLRDQVGVQSKARKIKLLCSDCWSKMKSHSRADGSDQVLRRDNRFWFYDGSSAPDGFTWAQDDESKEIRVYFGAPFRECVKCGSRLSVVKIKNAYQISGFRDKQVAIIPSYLKNDEIGIKSWLDHEGQENLETAITNIILSIREYDGKDRY